jgi:hypothetical protein
VKFLTKVFVCAFVPLLLVTTSIAAADALQGMHAGNFSFINPGKTADHVGQKNLFAQADIDETATVSKSSEKDSSGYTHAQIQEMITLLSG